MYKPTTDTQKLERNACILLKKIIKWQEKKQKQEKLDSEELKKQLKNK